MKYGLLLVRLRKLSSVTGVYLVTLFCVWQGFADAKQLVNPNVDAKTFYVAPATKRVVRLTSADIKPDTVQGTPIKLQLPSLSVDKEVIPGLYDEVNGIWNVSDIGVHYAHPSYPANNALGNTLLYAHNNNQAFGRLFTLKPGDKAVVITENNQKFTYIYIGSDFYDPSDTTLFTYAGPPQLVLQTCGGLLNEVRYLYTFAFESVEKLK